MIKMGNFYGSDINENFLSFINYYLNDAYQKNIELSSGSGNINCLVPHFFLLSVLEAVFNDVNYNLIGQFIQDTGIQKLIVFNNYALDKMPEAYIVTAQTTSEKIYSSNTERLRLLVFDIEDDPDNLFNLTTSAYRITTSGMHKIDFNFMFKTDEFIPGDWQMSIDLYINDIYQEQALWFVPETNYKIYVHTFNFNVDAADIGKDLIFKIDAFAAGEGDLTYDYRYKLSFLHINPVKHNSKNIFDGDIDMKNHVPDISVSDFVNNLVKLYSLAVFTNKKKEIEFTFWKDILANNKLLNLTEYYIKDSDEVEVYKNMYSLTMPFSDDEIDKREIDIYPVLGSVFKKDIPSPLTSNEVYYLKDINRWIMSYFDYVINNLEWKPYRDNFDNINKDVSNAKEIQINVKTLQMHFNGYPVSNLQGTSPEFGLGKTAFPFQLLYYFGIIPNGSYATFPYTSNNQYKPDGTSGADNALRLNDADGIYEKYSKSYYDYAAERDINTVMLNINDKILADIVNLFEAGAETRKIRIVNKNYLPVQIDVEIGMNGIKSCKAKLR